MEVGSWKMEDGRWEMGDGRMKTEDCVRFIDLLKLKIVL